MQNDIQGDTQNYIESDSDRQPFFITSVMSAAKRLFKLPADDVAFATPGSSATTGQRVGRYEMCTKLCLSLYSILFFM